MKCRFFALLTVLMCVFCSPGAADKARNIDTDAEQEFHQKHLLQHLNDAEVRVTGNYIKVRKEPKTGSKVIGHVEQADTFVILEVSGSFVRLLVLDADSSSPDSWNGMEGWASAVYVDCGCTEAEYITGIQDGGLLVDGFFPVNMPSKWYFASGAGAWSTELTISEDGSFSGYYHDWDGGSEAAPRGELQECVFSGRFSAPERISRYEYRIVVAELQENGNVGESFYRDEMLVTISHAYGISDGDSFVIYQPGTALNRIPPAYHEWAYVENDEMQLLGFALYNMTGAYGWNAD